jgi:hypothetical protein
MTTKHLPLHTGNGGNMVLSKDGEVLFFTKDSDLAAFIVRACNNHYKLLSAIKNLLDDMYDCDAERKYIDACLEAVAEAEKE